MAADRTHTIRRSAGEKVPHHQRATRPRNSLNVHVRSNPTERRTRPLASNADLVGSARETKNTPSPVAAANDDEPEIARVRQPATRPSTGVTVSAPPRTPGAISRPSAHAPAQRR